MYSLFYAAELSGGGIITFAGAKVQQFSDICKFVKQILQNLCKMAQKKQPSGC